MILRSDQTALGTVLLEVCALSDTLWGSCAFRNTMIIRTQKHTWSQGRDGNEHTSQSDVWPLRITLSGHPTMNSVTKLKRKKRTLLADTAVELPASAYPGQGFCSTNLFYSVSAEHQIYTLKWQPKMLNTTPTVSSMCHVILKTHVVQVRKQLGKLWTLSCTFHQG